MTYEEKRELRLQISQLLADAGLNQKTIKDIVEEVIQVVLKDAEVAEGNNCSGLGYEECNACEMQCPYR